MQRSRAAVLLLFALGAARAENRPIDTAKSVMTVRVFRSGVLSAFGHDHEIAAPIAGGTVDVAAGHVELRIDTAALWVADPKASEKDRAEIQKTMLGPEVLDSARYTGIAFRSSSAEPAGAGAWRLRGELTLHGTTNPVEVEVRESGGHYLGSVRLKQSDFGMRPIKVAGGTVRVKDEVRIEFDVQLAQ